MASLRRISLPETMQAVLTQGFAQVGFSVFRQFELIVLPGAAVPSTDTAPKLGSLTVRSHGSALTSNDHLTTLTTRSTGPSLSARGLVSLTSRSKQ